jgi:hypothetical protein
MTDAIVPICRRTKLGPRGKITASGRNSSLNTRDGVYWVHGVCTGVVPGSGSCRVRAPIEFENEDSARGAGEKSGVPRLPP